MIKRIREELFGLQDKEYGAFSAKLNPTIDPDTVIGVRTPALRKLAKQLIKEDRFKEFLQDLPHDFFDENQLHAFIISEIKDYELCMEELEKFLPYIDNWATCDQMTPKVFKKHKSELLEKVKEWIASQETYIIRFGIKMLMSHFLDDNFDKKYLEMVATIRSEEYYVNMMIAWFFATALAKQYEQTLPYIEEKRLEDWTHNKAIQKAVESNRISAEQKQFLKTLKVK